MAFKLEKRKTVDVINVKSIENFVSYLKSLYKVEYLSVRNFFDIYGVPILYFRQINISKPFESLNALHRTSAKPRSPSDFYREKNLNVKSEERTFYLYSSIKAIFAEEGESGSELSEMGITEKRDIQLAIDVNDWKKLGFTTVESKTGASTSKSANINYGIYYPLQGDLIILPPFEPVDPNLLQEISDNIEIGSQEINLERLRRYQLYTAQFKITRPIYSVVDVQLNSFFGTKFAPPQLLVIKAVLAPFDQDNIDIIYAPEFELTKNLKTDG